MLKEIEWHLLGSFQDFERLKDVCISQHLTSSSLTFSLMNIKLNVYFQQPSFIDVLVEKFEVTESLAVGSPEIFFVDRIHNPTITERLSNHGYVSPCREKAIVFSDGSGVFKSVINGFASYIVAVDGYVPVHASIVEVDGHGILFTGGHNAGKTTVLVNFIDSLIRAGNSVKILTDDWAVVKNESDGYVARTFDPSISLRLADLQDNSDMLFANNEHLKRLFANRNKVSLNPEILYGIDCSTEMVIINTIVSLVGKSDTGRVITTKITGDESQAIVEAAYHYPYLDSSQIARHVSFWHEALRRVRFISFARNDHKDKVENINLLRKAILL